MSKGSLAVEHLRSIPLLRGLSDADLERLAARFEPVVVGRDALFVAGDPAERLFLLTDGEVVLSQDGSETHVLHPPTIIGEVGALTGRPRSSRAECRPGAELWAIRGEALRALLSDEPALGLAIHQNLLDILAEKVARDQRRLGDMRSNIIRTQKALKRMRDFVLDSVDTPISGEMHDTIDELIRKNRRANYRVAPPDALPAALKLDDGTAPVVEISRTHVSYRPDTDGAGEGERVSGVLHLGGPEIPVSGVVLRVIDGRVDVELDLLIDDFVAILEGYITRVQMLDFLV